ncbi:MAG: undecaprenyl-diphosphate phosphatase [Planctomycetota bacterium]
MPDGSLPDVVAMLPLDSEGGSLTALLALAVLQGLTEFLPVSSSGHLVLGRELFGLESIEGVLITVALHLGTLVAVLGVYGRDLLAVLRNAIGGQPRELGLILLGTLPAAAVGLGFKDALEPFFEAPDVAAGGLLATAAILLAGEAARRRRAADPVDPGSTEMPLPVWVALAIGCAQALAICPGISRSGSTIAVGLLCGLSADRAARFSFLLSLPAVGGAALLEAKDLSGVAPGELRDLGLGLIVSAIVGLAALRLLLVALRKGSFPWFAGYCALAGLTWFLFG